jgi:uncharacterized protein (DUF885 family)
MVKKRFILLLLTVFAVALLSACGRQSAPTDSPVTMLDAATDELFQHRQATEYSVRVQTGLPITELADFTLETLEKEAAFAQGLLERLQAIPADSLPHDQAIMKALLEHDLWGRIEAPKHYWLEFLITPYNARQVIGSPLRVISGLPLATEQERANYLQLISEFSDGLDQIRTKTLGQKERGILLPGPAIAGALAMFKGNKTSVAAALRKVDERLDDLPKQEVTDLKAQLDKLVQQVEAGFDAIVTVLDDNYRSNAPGAVGVGQYVGGKQYYEYRIRLFIGLDPEPEAIHELGKKRLQEIAAKQKAIRDQLGFTGSAEDFKAALRKDKRLFADTPTQVEENYMRYVRQIEPKIADYFSVLPKAPYGVRRLKPAEEPGLTYGYYSRPTPLEPMGYYNYNGSKLDERSQIGAQHLIYHELIPGHHFHIATQQENSERHPIRKFITFGSFTEGWGEYAASLGEEMGLYEDSYDFYGHLCLQAFLANRLVVDTGMNYFGWPLEKAREFMAEHTFASEVQIETETLRYSTDMPAQALNYRIGFEKIWELRHKAEAALGDKFDVREFHAQTVGQGAMPLSILEDHINWYISQSETLNRSTQK